MTQIVLRLRRPVARAEGFTTLLVVILFLGGIQLLCLAIIGSYLAHIYDEVKRRPSYIVESVLNAPQSGSDDHDVKIDAAVANETQLAMPRRSRHEAPRRVRGGRP